MIVHSFLACGGTYREPSGILKTPFYGESGDNDTNEICIYVIRQQPSKLISLIFEVYSYYDQSINATNCTSNYIEVSLFFYNFISKIFNLRIHNHQLSMLFVVLIMLIAVLQLTS